MTPRPNGRFERRRPEPGYRINHRIRAPEVRVVLDGEQIGIMSPGQAMRIAEDRGLDLVEISPRAMPPVCRIMDYGKFKYEEAKKKQIGRRTMSTMETKEIKFRPKTEGHDLDFKARHIRRFLEEGNKVRLVVVFRGREMAHPMTGKAMLDRVVERCTDIAIVEAQPSFEGRRMSMLLGPKPAVLQKAHEMKKAKAEAQIAAQIAQKDAAHQPDVNEDDIDEDTINADVDGDDVDGD